MNANEQHLKTQLSDQHLGVLAQGPDLQFASPALLHAPQIRLIRLDEINEEGHRAYRHALANVYASLDSSQPIRLLYLLAGGPDGVKLYFGVISDTHGAPVHEAMSNLRAALEGQLPGINFGSEVDEAEKQNLLQRLSQSTRQGVLLGTPALPKQPTGQEEEENFQDLDRLIRALKSGSSAGDHWQMLVLSQPLSPAQVHVQLDAAYELSSALHLHSRTNLNISHSDSEQATSSSNDSHSDSVNQSQADTSSHGHSDTQSSSTTKTHSDNTSVTQSDSKSDAHSKNKTHNTTDTASRSNSNSNSGTEQRQSQSKSSSNTKSEDRSSSEASGSGSSETSTNSTSDSKTATNTASTANSNSTTHTGNTNKSHSKTDGTNKTTTKSLVDSSSKTSNTTHSLQQEIANKRAHHLMEYVDKQLITRFQQGLTKGLFHTVVYLSADNAALYQRLKHTVRATFQGTETTLAPLQVHDLPPSQQLCLPALAHTPAAFDLLFQSLHANPKQELGSLLTADELASIAALPQHEMQGIRRRRSVEFIVALPEVQEQPLKLGLVLSHGRPSVSERKRLFENPHLYQPNPLHLSKPDLNKHVFITGVTGAGKTTTCLNLLLQSDLPFLVIEPAKTEYRVLHQRVPDICFFRPNGDDHQSLRINPFALIRSTQRIKSHAGFLKNVFTAIFPMEGSMPAMVEAAILAAYQDKGWDIDDNEFLLTGDPFDPLTRAWPTLSDMIGQLDRIIPTYNLGTEFQEKYRGSLVSRFRSLTDGTLGQVLDVPQSLDFDALLNQKAVIELEELQSGEEKALLMALLLGGINEAIRARHAAEPSFRHLTLIEEAHRLLSRPEPGDKAAALAVEAFADMLAEVRKYGEGLIIADQIPAKLIPDVIKNTHTKIVHRLFAEDDRRAMGEAMMMNEEQRNFLPNLYAGEAVVFCGGWHGPAHVAVRNDGAQTDATNQAAIDIDQCGIQQLWQQRQRYYPQLSQLSCWSDEPQPRDKEQFAHFVRETRQAQKHLLQLAQDLDSPTKRHPHSALLFKRFKQWHIRWHAQLGTHLLGTWIAMLRDGNPRLRAEQTDQDLRAFTPPNDFHAELLNVVAQTNDIESWRDILREPSNARLKVHLIGDLIRFKSL